MPARCLHSPRRAAPTARDQFLRDRTSTPAVDCGICLQVCRYGGQILAEERPDLPATLSDGHGPKACPIREMPVTRVLMVLDLAVLPADGRGSACQLLTPIRCRRREGATVPELFTWGAVVAGRRELALRLDGPLRRPISRVWIRHCSSTTPAAPGRSRDTCSRLRASENRQKRAALGPFAWCTRPELVVLGVSGLRSQAMAMYKPGQFWWLSGLFSFAEPFSGSAVARPARHHLRPRSPPLSPPAHDQPCGSSPGGWWAGACCAGCFL